MPRGYGLRRRTERFLRALKAGARIEDRRPDLADDPGKCPAVDAIPPSGSGT